MWEMILVFICRGHCMLHAQSHMKISCASLHIQKCAKKCTRITQNINTFEDMQGRTQEKRNLWSSSWGSVQYFAYISMQNTVQQVWEYVLFVLLKWRILCMCVSSSCPLHPGSYYYILGLYILAKIYFFYVFRQMHLVSILDRHMHYTPWHQGW